MFQENPLTGKEEKPYDHLTGCGNFPYKTQHLIIIFVMNIIAN